MKKEFTSPEIEIIWLDEASVIVTSNCSGTDELTDDNLPFPG